MAEIKVVVDDGKRARNIVIGVVAIAAITYWHFTGAIPLLAETMVPQPNSEKLMSAWSIGTSLLGDVLYFVGIAVSGIISGGWSLLVSGIRFLVQKTNTKPETPAVQSVTSVALDLRLQQVLDLVSGQLTQFESKLDEHWEHIELLQKSPTAKASPATRTRKAQS